MTRWLSKAMKMGTQLCKTEGKHFPLTEIYGVVIHVTETLKKFRSEVFITSVKVSNMARNLAN